MIRASRRLLKMQHIVGLTSGMLASAALPPLGFVVLILALGLPFGLLAISRSGRDAFWLGWATGFGWFFLSLWWISKALETSGGGHVFLIPFAALGVPLLLGLFWALAFLVTARCVMGVIPRLSLIAVMLSLAEYGRGFVLTGFPWNAPGMIFANHDAMLASASVFGIWGLTLAAIMLAVLPGLILARAWLQAMFFLAVILAVPAAGFHHLDQPESPAATSGMAVRVIQPNIDQRSKWDRSKRSDHLVQMMEMSRRQGQGNPALIIWPETAFAGFISDEQAVFDAVTGAVTGGDSAFITGALQLREGKPFRFYNSAVLVAPDGALAAGYDKQHLVPFGEYVPFRVVLPFIDALAGPNDFSAGKGMTPMVVRGDDGSEVSILPLICYEVIFAGAVRQSALARNAGLIVTITNDAWFGDTIGPRQHLAMAQMRSAELGLPMLRAANTGISAVIDAKGRVTHYLDYGLASVVDARLGGIMDTFYSHFGDLVFFSLLFFLLLVSGVQQGLTSINLRR